MTHSPVPQSPLRVAVVGCGFVSDIYFKNLLTFAQVEVVACADLNPKQAERAAAQYGIPLVLTPEEAYAHPDIDLILNLTIPAAHAEVSLAALRGGKHVYNEKPLALALADAQEMMRLASGQGWRNWHWQNWHRRFRKGAHTSPAATWPFVCWRSCTDFCLLPRVAKKSPSTAAPLNHNL